MVVFVTTSVVNLFLWCYSLLILRTIKKTYIFFRSVRIEDSTLGRSGVINCDGIIAHVFYTGILFQWAKFPPGYTYY